ncbi:MAG: pantoate--beta-alanine ligase [candidate division NC10 bacterium]|nr:pantoate--beta-alanine ligase [candidate division NC10 bacterium]
MQIIGEPLQMQRVAEEARRAGKSIGCVPTMGALHEGHLSLIRRSRAENDLVVMTLFVNPIQFDRKDDLARYPRDLDRDARLAGEAGVDIIYSPGVGEMYPDGYATYVTMEGLADRWEGATRPGHFRGVATVCTKLFTACRPHRAYFGQKDYQQSLVVRRLVADLNLGFEIVVLPTVREADGLALSSRNVLLSAEERRQASVLFRSLSVAQAAVKRGERDAEKVRAGIEAQIRSAPLAVVDYVAVCDPDTLDALTRIAVRAVALVAARFGATRLIDNVLLEP